MPLKALSPLDRAFTAFPGSRRGADARAQYLSTRRGQDAVRALFSAAVMSSDVTSAIMEQKDIPLPMRLAALGRPRQSWLVHLLVSFRAQGFGSEQLESLLARPDVQALALACATRTYLGPGLENDEQLLRLIPALDAFLRSVPTVLRRGQAGDTRGAHERLADELTDHLDAAGLVTRETLAQRLASAEGTGWLRRLLRHELTPARPPDPNARFTHPLDDAAVLSLPTHLLQSLQRSGDNALLTLSQRLKSIRHPEGRKKRSDLIASARFGEYLAKAALATISGQPLHAQPQGRELMRWLDDALIECRKP